MEGEWGILLKGGSKDAHYLHNAVDSVVVEKVINAALCT